MSLRDVQISRDLGKQKPASFRRGCSSMATGVEEHLKAALE